MDSSRRTLEETAGAAPGIAGVRAGQARGRIAVWRRSLAGKITLVFLGGVILAYGVGALVGWIMFVSATSAQWKTQALLNTQIASATLRSIYTYVSVNVDDSGQIDRIVTQEPIGDDASVLMTGFNPIDVLSLVSAQTKNATWLYRFDPQAKAFVSVAVAYAGGVGSDTLSTIHAPLFAEDGVKGHLVTGFATIDGVEHFVGLLPIVTPKGEILGAVAASIGQSTDLYRDQHLLLRNSLLVLVAVMGLTSIAITIVAGHLLKPVPALVQATMRIAREVTDSVTPFQSRNDEIGDMAMAIEALREAVVERGRLREIRDMAVQMEHMAHHDTLTGLPNRALLMKTLNAALGACTMGAVYNVMLLDLDRFKAVNDTLGHASGDALLIAFADRLRGILGPDDMAARLGGDEFAILQKVAGNAEADGGRLAGLILDAASSTFLLDGHDVRVGTSLGIATIPLHGTSSSQILQCADVALYRAKAAGRGTMVFFRDGMDMAVQDQHALEMDLKMALLQEEFEVHYQPIVHLPGEGIAAFEALVRWNHPRMGMVSPDRFIPIAEETGAIVTLGEWILGRACRDAATWPETIRIAVNLSAVQLRHASIVETVARSLAASGLAADRLELEVTETAMLTGAESIAALKALGEMGVRIVLDDFGTGYASLSSIMDVRFSKLKIDRRFVAGLPDDGTCRAIVGSVTALARQMDMQITAEGVETEAQASMLKAIGCFSAQGYYFGRPRPLADLAYDVPPANAPRRNVGGRR